MRHFADPFASTVNDENLERFHVHISTRVKIMIEFHRALCYIYKGLGAIQVVLLIFCYKVYALFAKKNSDRIFMTKTYEVRAS